MREEATARVVLVGAKGMLAQAVRAGLPSAWELVAGLDLPDFDATDRELVRRTLGEMAPDLVINCAALTDVDGCESREELATRVNGEVPGYLAQALRDFGGTLVHLSTDYVFDGAKQEPYTEEDTPSPLCAYGRSKLLGERRVLDSGLERAFIVRTAWLYGAGGRNFVETVARLASGREELRIVADQVGSPTWTADLTEALFTLVRAAPFGLYHVSGEGACSWHGFAEEIVRLLRARGPVLARMVRPIRTEEYPLPAPRPRYSVLSKAKYRAATGKEMPRWQDSLEAYMGARGT